jgi:regulator of sigma E protease
VVSIVLPGEPAHRAGMRPGDVIVRVNGDTVVSWGQLVATIRGSGGDTLWLDILRGDERLQFVVVPKLRGDMGSTQRSDTAWRIGANINAPMVYVAQPLGQAVVDGFRITVERTGAVIVFLGRLVTGGVSVREVGGVVLIAQLTGQAAQLGFVQLIGFVAFISLNLAVINLLPIPVLDGGHVMFLLIEGIRGKPVSLGVRLRLTQVGFVLLLTLMVLAISNDVLRNLGR